MLFRISMSRVTAVVLLTIAAMASLAAPVAAAQPQPGDPLPACRYADVTTRYVDPTDWRKTLLDTERMLKHAYVPPRLVDVRGSGVAGSGLVRRQVIPDLVAMAAAARKAGAAFAVRSAYRSYEKQQAVFRAEIRRYGYTQALRQSARPGHSEHQLGTAVDLRSADNPKAPWDYPDWGTTAAGIWLARNASSYGFVMSYPDGGSAESCYMYEPWHFRYFGRPLAARIHQSGQVPRTYLWTAYETAG